MRKVYVAVRSIHRLDIHSPDREDPEVRVVAVEDSARVPGALADRSDIGEVWGTMRVPKVHEVVLRLVGLVAPYPHVRVAPARSIKGAYVVAAQESHPSVHREEVAMVSEDVAWIRKVCRSPQGAEVERVDLLWETLE